MPRSRSKNPDDPFDGLLLPMSTWKALEDAHITSRTQLQTMASVVVQMPDIGPETAQVIRDRLSQLTTKASVRVKLISPKQLERKAAAALPV